MTEKWELDGIDCDEIEANSSPVSYTHLDVYKRQIKDGALDIVTRELAESGKSPAQATLDTKI